MAHIPCSMSGYNKKSIVWVLFISMVLLLAGGCRKRPKRPPMGAPEVAVFTVSTEKVLLTTELPGRVVPFRVAEIRPQVSGLLKRRLFREGSHVRAGELLYIIDPSEYQAALDNAKAALAKAQAALPSIKKRMERYEKLLPSRAVSKQEYDDAVSAFKQAKAEISYWKAQVKNSRIKLGYCYIKAPISGRITRSYVTEGAILTAYQPNALAVIQRLDPIYVDVPQSTRELLTLRRKLREGRLKYHATDQDKVSLILEDGTPYPGTGILRFHEVNVDKTTASVILRITFHNPKGILLPGMFVRAVIKEGINPRAILVPQEAVARTTKGEPYVYLVGKDNTVSIRMIAVDRAVGNKWLVSSGLKTGERVIVEGLQFVRPGIKVKIVPLTKKGAFKKPHYKTRENSLGGRV